MRVKKLIKRENLPRNLSFFFLISYFRSLLGLTNPNTTLFLSQSVYYNVGSDFLKSSPPNVLTRNLNGLVNFGGIQIHH
jgi:hypothetical protein